MAARCCCCFMLRKRNSINNEQSRTDKQSTKQTISKRQQGEDKTQRRRARSLARSLASRRKAALKGKPEYDRITTRLLRSTVSRSLGRSIDRNGGADNKKRTKRMNLVVVLWSSFPRFISLLYIRQSLLPRGVYVCVWNTLYMYLVAIYLFVFVETCVIMSVYVGMTSPLFPPRKTVNERT